MAWITLQQATEFATSHPMGEVWPTLSDENKQQAINAVSARWASLPWLPNREPALAQPDADPTNDLRTLDASLTAAFAQHLRSVAELNLSPNTAPAQALVGQDTESILSDMPIYVRNILLGRYVAADADPNQAEQYSQARPLSFSDGSTTTTTTTMSGGGGGLGVTPEQLLRLLPDNPDDGDSPVFRNGVWVNEPRPSDGADGAPGTPGTDGTDGMDGMDGTDGTNGWSPILVARTDGARIVHQVSNWTGGTGTMPTTGQYVGPTGLVNTIGAGVDIRGPAGPPGERGEPGMRGDPGPPGAAGATPSPRDAITISPLPTWTLDGVSPYDENMVTIPLGRPISEVEYIEFTLDFTSSLGVATVGPFRVNAQTLLDSGSDTVEDTSLQTLYIGSSLFTAALEITYTGLSALTGESTDVNARLHVISTSGTSAQVTALSFNSLIIVPQGISAVIGGPVFAGAQECTLSNRVAVAGSAGSVTYTVTLPTGTTIGDFETVNFVTDFAASTAKALIHRQEVDFFTDVMINDTGSSLSEPISSRGASAYALVVDPSAITAESTSFDVQFIDGNNQGLDVTTANIVRAFVVPRVVRVERTGDGSSGGLSQTDVDNRIDARVEPWSLVANQSRQIPTNKAQDILTEANTQARGQIQIWARTGNNDTIPAEKLPPLGAMLPSILSDGSAGHRGEVLRQSGDTRAADGLDYGLINPGWLGLATIVTTAETTAAQIVEQAWTDRGDDNGMGTDGGYRFFYSFPGQSSQVRTGVHAFAFPFPVEIIGSGATQLIYQSTHHEDGSRGRLRITNGFSEVGTYERDGITYWVYRENATPRAIDAGQSPLLVYFRRKEQQVVSDTERARIGTLDVAINSQRPHTDPIEHMNLSGLGLSFNQGTLNVDGVDRRTVTIGFGLETWNNALSGSNAERVLPVSAQPSEVGAQRLVFGEGLTGSVIEGSGGGVLITATGGGGGHDDAFVSVATVGDSGNDRWTLRFMQADETHEDFDLASPVEALIQQTIPTKRRVPDFNADNAGQAPRVNADGTGLEFGADPSGGGGGGLTAETIASAMALTASNGSGRINLPSNRTLADYAFFEINASIVVRRVASGLVSGFVSQQMLAAAGWRGTDPSNEGNLFIRVSLPVAGGTETGLFFTWSVHDGAFNFTTPTEAQFTVIGHRSA